MLRSVLLQSSDTILRLIWTSFLRVLRKTKTGEKALFLLLRVTVIYFDGLAVFHALHIFMFCALGPLQCVYMGKASGGLVAIFEYVLLLSTLITGFAISPPLITHFIVGKLFHCG